MKIVGVDIGGTRIKAGLVENGRILKRVEIETEANKGKDKVVQNITQAIESVFEKDIKGIGIGFAGMVDTKKGKILISPHIPIMEKFNMKKFFEKRFNKKVEIDNEVTAATIAEAKYGAGTGYKNIVMITIGTGIGGGIMIDRKMYRGKGCAGEIGHMSINKDDAKSTCCKNQGCFEEYASVRALQKIYRKKIGPKEIAGRAIRGDKKAKEAYNEIGRNLGVGVVNITNIFHPDIVIIGGGISKSFELFEKEMRKTIKERELLKTKIEKAKLQDPGIIGAALLITSS